MADQIVQEIYGQIQSKKKILVTPPQEDAPSVDITNIRMPSPPSYKVGDKVQSWAFSGLAAQPWFSGFQSPGPRCISGRLGKGFVRVRRSPEVLVLTALALFPCTGSERT